MKGETPERQWERLQREYQNAVQSAYPNPERRGCSGQEALKSLAARSAHHDDIEADEHWHHVTHCAPCYQEYLEFRLTYRNAAKTASR